MPERPARSAPARSAVGLTDGAAPGRRCRRRRSGRPGWPGRCGWCRRSTARPLYWTCRVALRHRPGAAARLRRRLLRGLRRRCSTRPTAAATPPRRRRSAPSRAPGRRPPGRTSRRGRARRRRPGARRSRAATPAAEPSARCCWRRRRPEERLRQTSFAELTADEIDAVRGLVRGLVLATPPRRSRRTRRSRRVRRPARPAPHRAARRSAPRGDPVRLVHAAAGGPARAGWSCSATSPARWSPTRGST